MLDKHFKYNLFKYKEKTGVGLLVFHAKIFTSNVQKGQKCISDWTFL